MTLTKAELIYYLCDEYIISRKDAKSLVDDVFENIRCTLESAESVKITNFGNFDIRDKSSRPGRNPKTGEVIPVSARRVVTFKAGQNLKAQIAERANKIFENKALGEKETLEAELES